MKSWIQKIREWFGWIPPNKRIELDLMERYQNLSDYHLIRLLEDAVEREEYEIAALIKKILDRRNVKVLK